MARSGSLPIVAAMAILSVTVLIPAGGLGWIALTTEASGVEMRSGAELLARSLGWAIAVAIGATAVGWIPGRWLGRSLGTKRFVPVTLLIVAPLCLPAYLVFYAWFQSWPADSAVFRWAASAGHIQLLREVTLFAGLLCWSWPIVSLCVATSSSQEPASEVEQFSLDGAHGLSRIAAAMRRDAGALCAGSLIVALLTLNNTTCFDLAFVFTFGNELRAIEALGANTRDAMTVSMPVVLIGLAGALLLWGIFRPTNCGLPVRRAQVSGGMVFGSMAIVGACFVVPFVLLFGRLALQANVVNEIGRFLDLYDQGVLLTVAVGVITGLIGGVIAIGLTITWLDRRSSMRSLGHVAAFLLVVSALVPGILVGVALEAAYNHDPFPGSIYRSPAILVLGHLARFGIVAALLGRWLSATEPRDLADSRELDGVSSLGGILAAARPRIVPAVIGSVVIIAVMSMSEIPVTSFVSPPARPGAGPIAVKILNDMHYQRPQTVMIAALAMVVFAFGAAALLAFLWRGVFRTAKPFALALTVVITLSLVGCGDDGDGAPLPTRLTFGSPGLSLGQFSYPRACAADPDRERLFVVDKTARVQRFGFDGEPQLEWRMPEWENGKPTGMNISPDGHVFIADTHYYRVIEYDGDGNEIRRFGEYGIEPGQFIYPTDVEFGPDGSLYVAEYGGNDRIQVFTPEGEFLFAFGEIGEERNQFNRPQSMVFNAEGTELYVADSCNHRIVVLTPDGEVLRIFGTPGDAPGQLSYPYDLMLLDDGTLLVCEFGNNRLQHFTAAGESLGVYGRVGMGDGELQYPWALDGGSDAVFVVDSGNNRVQQIRPP